MIMNQYILEIYNRVRVAYPSVILTNTFSLNAGYTIDADVICGESALGKFHLFSEGRTTDEFVFSVEFQKTSLLRKKPKTHYTHCHPQDVEEAVELIADFMEGRF